MRVIEMLNNDLLKKYINEFFGFGSWKARVWFVGMEEAGDYSPHEINSRLKLWHVRGQRDLETISEFCGQLGHVPWFGTQAAAQATWIQIIRMQEVAYGRSSTHADLLHYQRHRLGGPDDCLAELFPLPCKRSAHWPYKNISKMPALEEKTKYKNTFAAARIGELKRRIETYQPKVVVFYGRSYKDYCQEITGKLFEKHHANFHRCVRGKTAFILTLHPAAYWWGATDAYFRDIGEHIRQFV